jgi:hypothetical protein
MCGDPFETDSPKDILRLCGAAVQLTRLLRKLRVVAPSANDMVAMAQPIERARV